MSDHKRFIERNRLCAAIRERITSHEQNQQPSPYVVPGHIPFMVKRNKLSTRYCKAYTVTKNISRIWSMLPFMHPLSVYPDFDHKRYEGAV